MSLRHLLFAAGFSLAGFDAGVRVTEMMPTPDDDLAHSAELEAKRREREDRQAAAIAARDALLTPAELAQLAELESYIQAHHISAYRTR